MVQKIGDPSTRVTVAQDVSRWTFSRDGKTIYWLKSFNYDPSAPLGTLQSTPFPVPPTGTAPTVSTIRPNVSFYNPAGDTGLLMLGALTSGAGQLSLMTDSAQASSSKVLGDMVSQPISLSQDGVSVVYGPHGGEQGVRERIRLQQRMLADDHRGGAGLRDVLRSADLPRFWAESGCDHPELRPATTPMSPPEEANVRAGGLGWNRPVKDRA